MKKTRTTIFLIFLISLLSAHLTRSMEICNFESLPIEVIPLIINNLSYDETRPLLQTSKTYYKCQYEPKFFQNLNKNLYSEMLIYSAHTNNKIIFENIIKHESIINKNQRKLALTISGYTHETDINNIDSNILMYKGRMQNKSILSSQSALLFTANNCYDGIVILLKNKIPINIKDHDGQTPLLLALTQGYVSIANLLINNGADVNAINNSKQSPLIIASIKGYTRIVKSLLQKKVLLDYQYQGRTSISLATEKNILPL